jgi:hypothetical protein
LYHIEHELANMDISMRMSVFGTSLGLWGNARKSGMMNRAYKGRAKPGEWITRSIELLPKD